MIRSKEPNIIAHLIDKCIIDCINTNYDIKVDSLTLLAIGADLNASVYKAKTPDLSSYFIKVKRGRHQDISATIITLLHKAGIQPLIPPIKTIQGQSIQPFDDYTIIVSPFIEGQDGFNQDLTDDQWVTLGKAMRQIHEIDVPSSLKIKREDYSSQWEEAVRSLYTKIDSKKSTDKISLKLIAFLKKHADIIHRLVNRADELAKAVQKLSPKLVLCHSDIHGGNVLIDRNNHIYLVDWDEPIMAPKERDLMFIGGGVANVWNKPHEEVLFYKGYGKTEINMTILAYYRHVRIVQDIAEICQVLLSPGDKNRDQVYHHFLAQFEPNGVVEIAFKSDENL